MESGTTLESRRWRVLALTSVGAFMTPLDGSIVAVALPVIGPELHLSFTEAIWVQASYLLVISTLLIPFGRLADARGRVRFYLVGVVVFGVASLLAALAVGGLWLVLARCLQGGGGALLGATSGALVTAVFPPQERGRALGINVMAVYLGLSVGPPLGGFLVTQAGWRWIFLVNLPVAALTLLAGWPLLRLERRERQAAGGAGPATRIDIVGATLLGVTLSCLLVPLTFAPFWGWSSVRTLLLLAAAGVALAAFVLVEDRVPDPVLDLDLLRRNRLFASANMAALLNYAAMHGVTILTAMFLEIVQGRPPQQAGLVLVIQPLLMASLSPLAGRLSDRYGSRLLATGGMILIAAGMVQLALLPDDAAVARILVALATVGVGMATFSTPNTSAVMGSVARSQLSLASGFLGTMRFAGQAISIALLGSMAAAYLGSGGGRVLFGHATTTGAVAADFADGYGLAMLVGAGLALAGAAVSLVRGPGGEAALGASTPSRTR